MKKLLLFLVLMGSVTLVQAEKEEKFQSGKIPVNKTFFKIRLSKEPSFLKPCDKESPKTQMPPKSSKGSTSKLLPSIKMTRNGVIVKRLEMSKKNAAESQRTSVITYPYGTEPTEKMGMIDRGFYDGESLKDKVAMRIAECDKMEAESVARCNAVDADVKKVITENERVLALAKKYLEEKQAEKNAKIAKHKLKMKKEKLEIERMVAEGKGFPGRRRGCFEEKPC